MFVAGLHAPHPPSGAATASTSVDNAEGIAFRIGEDHVVGIRGTIGLVRAGGTERKQSLDITSLVLGVEVKV